MFSFEMNLTPYTDHLIPPSCAVVYLLVGYGAHAVLGSRPAAARAVGIVSGIVMIGIGLFLIAEKLLR